MADTLRLAVVQSTVPSDLNDLRGLRAAGAGIRRLMAVPRQLGAACAGHQGLDRLPDKRLMSVNEPDALGACDWSRAAWDVIGEQVQAIRH